MNHRVTLAFEDVAHKLLDRLLPELLGEVGKGPSGTPRNQGGPQQSKDTEQQGALGSA